MTSSLGRRFTAIALLVVGLAMLHAAGSTVGAPSWPPGSARAGSVDPLGEAAAVLRLAAMAICVWLTLITVLEVIAQLARARPIADLAAALVPAAWRNLVLRPVALATLAAPQLLVPMTAVAPAAAQAPTEVDVAPDPSATRSGATLEMAPYAAPARTLTLALHEPEAIAPEPSESTAIPGASSVRVVGAGENLWSIAASHLSEQLGRRASPSEITPYWHAVITANRHTLPDPENPDLLYRGIELTMPPANG